MPNKEVNELRTHGSNKMAARGLGHSTTIRTELVETEILRVDINSKLGA